MKTKLLLFSIFCCTLWSAAYSAETEPNNTAAQANTLALNGSNTGSISPSGDLDWWKVTTTGNGSINIALTSTNGVYLTYVMYDNDAITVFTSTYTSGSNSFNVDGIAAGTYYIQVYANNGTDQGSYTLSNTFTNPPVANDVEPDNKFSQAKVLTLGGSKTGQVGYYYNHLRDTTDWFKVTTTGNGQLTISLTSENGHYVSYRLIDGNGSTQLASTYTSGTNSISVDGLAAGTYYVQIYCLSVSDFASYTVSSSFTAPAVSNDTEPDDISSQALTLSLSGSLNGQVGYYYNAKRDTFDWYKVTTTGNGQLTISMTSQNGHYVTYVLYDGNATSVLTSSYTSGTNSISVDGLAAGTYYVKVYCNSANDFASYTIGSSFTAPPVANDVEPDDKYTQAKTISINGTKTGQIGYYYNAKRDTFDWYKLTTNGDGLVRLYLTSNNGHYVTYQLIDGDGTTYMNGTYTSGNNFLSTDGLATGTYYIKLFCNSTNDFASYTLTDSLFKPAQANDPEPNGSKTLAQTLTLGATSTGHIGYYYKGVRDTIDWYKITTAFDGMITLSLTSNNGRYVTYRLLDNDGATVLNSTYTSSSNTINTDGLAAGTYYVQVYNNSLNDFAPYTLTNSLTQYVNTNDGFTNDVAKKAVTLNANGTTPGHVGFYYNGSRDLVDWWKINYTGSSGALTITVNQEGHLINGGTVYLTWQLYQDTNAAPIYTTYSSGASNAHSFTGLTQPTYYYVKVYCNSANDFASYSINPTWTQTNKAKVILQSATAGTDCSNGSIVYKCSGSHVPYTVQLYRYGLKYGTAIKVNNTAAFTMGSLPPGNYYATAYGDGATGSAKGTSAVSTIVPVPTNAITTTIRKTKATLNWDSLSCIKYDSIYYRVQGALTWTKLKTPTNHGSYTITGLTGSTTYEWEVAHVDTGNLQTATSAYTAIVTFTTTAMKEGDVSDLNTQDGISLYPNPTAGSVHLNFENIKEGMVTISLLDVTGRVIFIRHDQDASGMISTDFDLSNAASGMYTLQIITADGVSMNKQVVKE